MSNENVPKSAVSQFLKELNLPRLIAGPAGEAISRLVAGAADVLRNIFAASVKA